MFEKLRTQVGIAILAVFAWIFIGTLAYRNLEAWSWVESLYFSVITLTTVGYGDLHPTTDASRLFTVFYILTGVTTVLAALSIIGIKRLEKREAKVKKRRNKK
jgi:voltage-gated potassium channel Kch